MEKYKPTATLFLDKRVGKRNGTYPLKLTIYCKPQKKRYNLNIDLTEEGWNKLTAPRLKDESLKDIKIRINAVMSRAEKILEKVVPFSFQGFEHLFFETASNLDELNLKLRFTKYAKRHEEKGNIGTAISYMTSYNSLNSFKKNLTLNDITIKFLEDYEKEMISKGNSISTVGIYLRQLRAVYNDAVSQNFITVGNYPFGKNKYNIPAGRNIKKALSENEIEKIINYVPDCINQQKAKDFWVFSYLCSGMNFCDIAFLKKVNIEKNFIYYIRSKTKNTKKADTTYIKVPLHAKAKEILDLWKNNDENSEFIFPILCSTLTPIQVKNKIQNFIKKNNREMKKVQEALLIAQDCNTYSCRHSFATMLKRKNVSTEYISESLGHSSLQTTSSYLDSFEDDTKIEYSNLLTNFKSIS